MRARHPFGSLILKRLRGVSPRTRSLSLLLMALIVFGVGVFISRAVDRRLSRFVTSSLTKVRAKYGVQISVGEMNAGIGSITLSEVTIGNPGWMVIDRIDVAVSICPGRDFLKPSLVSIGQLVAKAPWERAQWPAELELMVKAITERVGEPGDAIEDAPKEAITSRMLPVSLSVDAARIELADKTETKLLTEKVSLTMNFMERRLQFRAARLFAFDRVDEQFIEGEARSLARGASRLTLKSSPRFSGPPVWAASCDMRHKEKSAACTISASRLPVSLVQPFQRLVGTGFQPGFYGAVDVTPLVAADIKRGVTIGVNGRFPHVMIDHPSLALTAIGPLTARVRGRARVDLAGNRLTSEKFQVAILPQGAADDESGLPAEINVDVATRRVTAGIELSSGFMTLDVNRVSCRDAIRSIPASFIPELGSFELGGTATFHGSMTFAGGGADFSLKNSAFDCVVRSAPEIYSASYLNSSFMIEREVPGGKIHIPVDPQRPYFASYASIPVLTRSAFVSSEDSGFFSHKGVEMSAIVGAAERNTEKGKAAVGGSTITMQTVKNLFLARDKTISRKAQEMFLAWHLEQTISKERILEIYLNMVEFGPDLYGIGRASQRFFGKTPGQLTLKESIYLASLLPAPVPRYRYFCKGELSPNYERIVRQLLDRMLSLGRVTSSQHAAAAAETISFSAIERDSACPAKYHAAVESDLSETQDRE